MSVGGFKDDQIVRVFCGAFSTVAYVARLAYHGNGPVAVLGYEPNSLVVLLVVLLVLAIPELVNEAPFLPWTKSK